MCAAFIKEKYRIISDLVIHHNKPKAHGLRDKEIMTYLVAKENKGLLIVPDAGSSDRKEVTKLITFGYDIIVLDHHAPVDGSSIDNIDGCAFVNNQTSDKVVNKSASGCLVAWHFLHYLDSEVANEYISYPAITIISDSMSFCTNENRTFLDKGLNKIHKNLINIIKQFNRDNTVHSYSWGGIIPKINSTIRLGSREDKAELLKYLSGFETDTKEEKKIFEFCKKYHNEQNKEVVSLIDNHVTIDDVKQNILLCDIDVTTALTGLVANRLMSKTQKPVLVVHRNDTSGDCSGSARSPIDLRDILNDSGLFLFNQGHQQAFGTSYKIEDESKIKDFIYHTTLPEPHISVVYTLTPDCLSTDLISLYEPYERLWGNDLQEPLYAVDFILNKNDIMVCGRTNTTIRWTYNNWSFVKFMCSHEWQEKTLCYDKMKITAIGTLKWNEYNGIKNPQMMIQNLIVKPVDEITYDDLFS